MMRTPSARVTVAAVPAAAATVGTGTVTDDPDRLNETGLRAPAEAAADGGRGPARGRAAAAVIVTVAATAAAAPTTTMRWLLLVRTNPSLCMKCTISCIMSMRKPPPPS